MPPFSFRKRFQMKESMRYILYIFFLIWKINLYTCKKQRIVNVLFNFAERETTLYKSYFEFPLKKHRRFNEQISQY